MMIDIFDKKPLNLNNITCHSGGAEGSDTYWETIGEKYGVKTKAYSYKTTIHKSKNKVEISDADYKEGISEVNKANHWLGRYGIHKYMNLLARNWAQVKYSDEVFAIGLIVRPGEKNPKGYYNKGKYDVVDGGTGYAVRMAINNNMEVKVFDQNKKKWFRWSHSALAFKEIDFDPKIEFQNFAGIGTREINEDGIRAIENLYKKTFEKK